MKHTDSTVKCECGGNMTVIDTRRAPNAVCRRRRCCDQCGKRETTYEVTAGDLNARSLESNIAELRAATANTLAVLLSVNQLLNDIHMTDPADTWDPDPDHRAGWTRRWVIVRRKTGELCVRVATIKNDHPSIPTYVSIEGFRRMRADEVLLFGPIVPTPKPPQDWRLATELPVTVCPNCSRKALDYDGFGLIHCQRCDWCSHPTRSYKDGLWICDICGQASAAAPITPPEEA